MAAPVFVVAVPISGTLGAAATTFSGVIDCTGCDSLVVGIVIGSQGGSVAAATISVANYAGAPMSTLIAKTMANGSNSAASALYGILTPSSGSNNIDFTTDIVGSFPKITVVAAGYSGVASFGNVASRADTASSDSSTLNLDCASGNTGAGFACHGSDITTVDQTIRGVANNYSTGTALNCAVFIESAGVGASTPFSANSGGSDTWNLMAVELVATSSSPAQVMTLAPVQSTVRLA